MEMMTQVLLSFIVSKPHPSLTLTLYFPLPSTIKVHVLLLLLLLLLLIDYYLFFFRYY